MFIHAVSFYLFDVCNERDLVVIPFVLERVWLVRCSDCRILAARQLDSNLETIGMKIIPILCTGADIRLDSIDCKKTNEVNWDVKTKTKRTENWDANCYWPNWIHSARTCMLPYRLYHSAPFEIPFVNIVDSSAQAGCQYDKDFRPIKTYRLE